MTCTNKMSHYEYIFKNVQKNLKIMYELLESDKND